MTVALGDGVGALRCLDEGASIGAVHPSDRSLPPEQIFHAARPSSDGRVIVAIHDSKESWEEFRDGTLMPRMQAGIGELRHRPERCSAERSPVELRARPRPEAQ